MRSNLSRCILAGLGLALAFHAHAATTGNINSTLTLTAACQVNGSSGTSGMNFGTLDFGTQDALFTSAGAQVMGGGGGAMSVLCSAGTIPVIRVRAGVNDGQSTGARARWPMAPEISCRTTSTPTLGTRSCWPSTAPSPCRPAPAWPRPSTCTARREARPACRRGLHRHGFGRAVVLSHAQVAGGRADLPWHAAGRAAGCGDHQQLRGDGTDRCRVPGGGRREQLRDA